MSKSGTVNLALLGAGCRGALNLGAIVKRNRKAMRFVAVAEADESRRTSFANEYGIPREKQFDSWQALIDRPQLADAVIIALPCGMHYASALASLRTGYHILLEKPMSHNPAQCVHLARAGRESGRVFAVSLQCRYNNIYVRVKKMLEQDDIGGIVNIDCIENIGYWHFNMSYVRGMHSQSPTAHSLMLSKGIHDMDLLTWFVGARAARVSSMGKLSFFRPGNAPEGAPKRCTDGCPVQDSCPFDAVKHFVDPGRPAIPARLLRGMSLRAVLDFAREPRFRTLASTITHDIRKENVLQILREKRDGLCVFHAENDTIDHQIVGIEFENGADVSFTLSAFSLIWERTCNFHGTKGEIRSDDFSGRLELRTYLPAKVSRKRVPYHGVFHGGGDMHLLPEFVKAVRRGTPNDDIFPTAESVLEPHLIGFASEEARKTGHAIDMNLFRKQAAEDAAALTAGSPQ